MNASRIHPRSVTRAPALASTCARVVILAMQTRRGNAKGPRRDGNGPQEAVPPLPGIGSSTKSARRLPLADRREKELVTKKHTTGGAS